MTGDPPSLFIGSARAAVRDRGRTFVQFISLRIWHNCFLLRPGELEGNRCKRNQADAPSRHRREYETAASRRGSKVFLTGKEKKPEVSEKRVYRISRKIIGFAILISDEI